MLSKKVTLERIEKYLERFGWKKYQSMPEPQEKEGVVLTGWQSSVDPSTGYMLIIDPMVEKGLLSLTVGKLVTAPKEGTPEQRLSGLLQAIASINYRMMMAKFGWDPRDGEIQFQVATVIDPDDLRYEEFEKCLQVTIASVEVYTPQLKAIVEGTAPVEDVLKRISEGPA